MILILYKTIGNKGLYNINNLIVNLNNRFYVTYIMLRILPYLQSYAFFDYIYQLVITNKIFKNLGNFFLAAQKKKYIKSFEFGFTRVKIQSTYTTNNTYK